MGVGGFLSAQAEVDHYHHQTALTSQRVSRSCLGEMEREVSEILEPFGLSKELSEKVASELRALEQARQQGEINNSEEGLTPFLLKHEGIEEIPTSRIWKSAITIGFSYFMGGLIPLLPYIFIKNVKDALLASCVVTGVILLLFGMIKQRLTGGETNAKGLIWSALSTLSGEFSCFGVDFP